MARDERNSAVDIGGATLAGEVLTVHLDCGATVCVRLSELDLRALGETREAGLILEVHAAFEGEPGYGAIHHSRIDQPVGKLMRQGEADRGLAGSDRAIDG